MKRKNIIIIAVLLLIAALAVVFYLFAISGITEHDVQDLPTCGTPEASSSLGCAER